MPCKTCKHYDLSAVLNKAGRVQPRKVARCLWVFAYPLPDSITQSFNPAMPPRRYMEPSEGGACPTFEPRNG